MMMKTTPLVVTKKRNDRLKKRTRSSKTSIPQQECNTYEFKKEILTNDQKRVVSKNQPGPMRKTYQEYREALYCQPLTGGYSTELLDPHVQTFRSLQWTNEAAKNYLRKHCSCLKIRKNCLCFGNPGETIRDRPIILAYYDYDAGVGIEYGGTHEAEELDDVDEKTDDHYSADTHDANQNDTANRATTQNDTNRITENQWTPISHHRSPLWKRFLNLSLFGFE
jgi:hypothetical protein